jgi:acetyltransferase-like isoleucine patch superfamily enzyme
VEDQGSLLRIGAKTSMTGATLQAKEGKRLEFGRDCMVGHGVEVANSDSHSLIDANSGERTNSARDVVIGSHVWIAAGATVAKGVRIGQGAVVAAGSRVLRDVPEQTLVAGCPATVRRTDVRWARERIGVTL